MPGLSGSSGGCGWGWGGTCVGRREASRDSQWTAWCLHPAPQDPHRAGESNPTLVRHAHTWTHMLSPRPNYLPHSHLRFSIFQGGEPEDCRCLPVQKSRVLGFYHLHRSLRPKYEPAGGQLQNFTWLCSHCSSVWGQSHSASLTLDTKHTMQCMLYCTVQKN